MISVVESDVTLLMPYMSPIDPLEQVLTGDEEESEDEIMEESEQQRKLNPIMKEVMKKEVIKWLDASIIFPISNRNWIVIFLEDREKMTFMCPYGTFAFKRMVFGLCNAPATFQRCMMAIFTDMVEMFVEVLMDDFSLFGLLEKDVTFKFDEAFLKAFKELKNKLVAAPIIVAPD
uniref:RNA-directed DNA polymerase homolog n=1 Tax=Nicotiana tabacum TaxID=4097 RepID=A0A1S3X9F0_TOBAC|nr:PREDICTED: uncharacterized protein LOC107762544 [Nicotiana tabacum]